jgi:hypothetical protein
MDQCKNGELSVDIHEKPTVFAPTHLTDGLSPPGLSSTFHSNWYIGAYKNGVFFCIAFFN